LSHEDLRLLYKRILLKEREIGEAKTSECPLFTLFALFKRTCMFYEDYLCLIHLCLCRSLAVYLFLSLPPFGTVHMLFVQIKCFYNDG